jgi:hypothetical protein
MEFKMNRLKVVSILCSLVLMALAVAPKAQADTWNKKTTLTFTEPFEVPGVGAQTLPAGTYVFKLVESGIDRNIVQIFSADELQLFTTVLAINNYRLKPSDKTVLTFKERGEGQPEAIKAWFYPGDNFGQEFVYPKKRAMELAKIVNEPVLEIPLETTAVPVETLKKVQIAAIQPTGEEVPVTAVVEPPPAAVAPAPVEVASALPNTASTLPLFAMAGLLSLCIGYALLIVTKRSA